VIYWFDYTTCWERLTGCRGVDKGRIRDGSLGLTRDGSLISWWGGLRETDKRRFLTNRATDGGWFSDHIFYWQEILEGEFYALWNNGLKTLYY
jgi:hypothetical protein